MLATVAGAHDPKAEQRETPEACLGLEAFLNHVAESRVAGEQSCATKIATGTKTIRELRKENAKLKAELEKLKPKEETKEE